MKNCTKCGGEGLIGGNKERPREMVGKVSTCDACTGTGKASNVTTERPTDHPVS